MRCMTCRTEQDRILCVNCARTVIYDGGQPWPTQQLMAQRSKLTEIWGNCPTHGKILVLVADGRCLTCSPRRNDTDRVAARRARLKSYTALCVVHGVTAHSVRTGLCATCYTEHGFFRALAVDNPRAAARRARRSTYEAVCPTHGLTAHNVVHGTCLTCFTTAGTRRRWVRVD